MNTLINLNPEVINLEKINGMVDDEAILFTDEEKESCKNAIWHLIKYNIDFDRVNNILNKKISFYGMDIVEGDFYNTLVDAVLFYYDILKTYDNKNHNNVFSIDGILTYMYRYMEADGRSDYELTNQESLSRYVRNIKNGYIEDDEVYQIGFERDEDSIKLNEDEKEKYYFYAGYEVLADNLTEVEAEKIYYAIENMLPLPSEEGEE